VFPVVSRPERHKSKVPQAQRQCQSQLVPYFSLLRDTTVRRPKHCPTKFLEAVMTRRRFIQDRNTLELVEVAEGYAQLVDARACDSALWGDRSYDGLRATDGTDISSRSKHRAYMRENNYTTVDDFKDTWAEAEQKRNEYRTTGRGGAVTREDIARALARQLDI